MQLPLLLFCIFQLNYLFIKPFKRKISASLPFLVLECIKGWKYHAHTGYCYKYFPAELRWTDAMSMCQMATGGEGGLASMHDDKTQHFFQGLATPGSNDYDYEEYIDHDGSGPLKPYKKEDIQHITQRKKRETGTANSFYVWLGLERNPADKAWEWSDKTPFCTSGISGIAGSFQPWGTREPRGEMNFGKMYGTSGELFGAEESQKHSFICQHRGTLQRLPCKPNHC